MKRDILLFALASCLGWAGRAEAAPTITGGFGHAHAIHDDGTLRSWGSDEGGTLGIGREMLFGSPQRVMLPAGVRLGAVAAGPLHVVGLSVDGDVYAWGANLTGTLGDGTTTTQTIPTRAQGLPRITQISSADSHSVALDADGGVWTWGSNLYGELGAAGSGFEISAPMRVALRKAVFIRACTHKTFAIDEEGSLWAWGRNADGSLGDGTLVDAFAPVRASGLTQVASVACGARHTLAVRRDGSVWSWGNNDSGVLGNGTTQSRLAPAPVAGISAVTMLSSSQFHVVALTSDGTVWTWGGNGVGQLGDGSRTARLVPGVASGLSGVVEVSAAITHSAARTGDGRIWTWGDNRACQLGHCGPSSSVPQVTGGTLRATAISASLMFTVAIDGDGAAWAWGINTSGQLGNNAATFRSTPAAVASISGVRGVAAGDLHSLAVLSNGTVLAWGHSFSGQTGDSTLLPVTRPQTTAGIAALTNIVAVSAGSVHSLALDAAGNVWGWGENAFGVLGLDVAITFNAMRIPGLADVAAIDAGPLHNVAVHRNGTVSTWGWNSNGQLGRGAPGGNMAPGLVPGLTDAIAASAGVTSTAVLRRDGSVWTFGGNQYGQLGDGTQTDRLAPVRVGGLPAVRAITVGYMSMAAVDLQGGVWTWGGTLGVGANEPRPTPRRIPNLEGVAEVDYGAEFLLVRRGDGTVISFGSNSSGQLADGTLVPRVTRVVALREDGAGSLSSNDWYLRLDPRTTPTVGAEDIPVFALKTEPTPGGFQTLFRPRAQDVGTQANVYVFALAPETVVKGDLSKATRIGFARGAGPKATNISCVIAQLNAAGQMVAVSSANLSAYLTGVLSGQGQAVSIINGVPASSIAGATFFVGYGSSPSGMLNSGTNRAVATIPTGGVPCQPQAPQTGWWWNPAEDGRGFSLERRGNNLFFASFLYDVSGRSTWYVSSGPVALEGALYLGDLLSARGGQALGGSYPGFPSLRNEGPMTLAFNSADRGTLIWPGGTVPIQRFNIVANGLTAAPVAGTPESGWWWNEAEAGRGFFMEWQNGTLDIAGYMYDDAGNPVWYLTVGGSSTTNPQNFTGTWWSYTGGQTLTGPWRQNARTNSNVAPLSITFSGPDTALMTLPSGRTTNLRRHRF